MKIGIKFTHLILPETVTESKVLETVRKMNNDYSVHGILVQLPLPESMNERKITEAIDPKKDVDGFCSMNIGLLAKKDLRPFFTPCTPAGVLKLLKHTGVEIAGKRAVIIGRSNIVVLRILI